MENLFAKNLQSLRRKKGFTQAMLADDLILSRSLIGAYEEGRAEPKYNRLIIIADYFKITIDELLKTEL